MNKEISFLPSMCKKKLQQGGLVVFSLLALVGCGESNNLSQSENPAAKIKLTNLENNQVKPKDTDPFARRDFKDTYQGISIPNLKKHIQYLSSDELGGRAPASIGDKMTVEYLVNEFKQLGLKPGNGDSYLQQVDLLAINSKVSQGLKIGDIEFTNTENYVASTRNKEKLMSLKDSELVFVGYGINAPEFGWNDYRDLDVKGKTVVMLVNDPGYATQDP